MSYNTNPRKVYGKVEIVFSDTDISSIDRVTTSSNAEISHPEEVYGDIMAPTVKACTMDGNAIMGGGYQMMDESCTLGWWSKEMSGSDGIFSNFPTLEIFFSERPIVSWLINGDAKLNQYPTDFLVEYKNGNTVVAHKEVLDNTQVNYKLIKTVQNVTSIKLTIYKLNVANACCKIMRFFDSLVETYEESDLQDFEVNEEMTSEDTSFSLNSDSMTVTIYNKERKFTTGYLKSLLILDRKVKPYIGTEVNGEIIYTPLGTFYSEEWKVSDDGRWVKCTACDKLMRLQNNTYIGFLMDYNITLYALLVDIFNKAKIPSDKYVISETLKEKEIPYVFMPKSSVWDALQQIAYTGLCNIYIDRSDKIVVSSISDSYSHSGIELTRNNMFSFVSNISLTEFANKVSVDYAEVCPGEEAITAAETDITLDAFEELEVVIDYTTEIQSAEMIISNSNITRHNFQSGTNACKVTFKNNTNTTQTALVTIYGPSFKIYYKTLSVQDDASVRDFGVFEYKHPKSDLIQYSFMAREIATKLLNRLKAGEGTITATWRGNPTLELGKVYNCDRGPDEENDLICESNKITFDGGLKEVTRGRKITGGN